MRNTIIAAAITALFSTMATANSGLADRINEARSYPNQTASNERSEMACAQHTVNDSDVSKSDFKHQENKSGHRHLNHTHS